MANRYALTTPNVAGNLAEADVTSIIDEAAITPSRLKRTVLFDFDLLKVAGVDVVDVNALALKAPIASPTFTGTVSGISKSMVGLTSVDDTADSAKPVSTAQQTALDLKLNLAGGTLSGALAMGTNKITGLGLATVSTDAASKAYVDSVAAGLDLKDSVRVRVGSNVADLGNPGAALDGVTLASGDRVLLAAQSDSSQNGIYVFNGAASELTRSTDLAAASFAAGVFTFVTEGTLADRGFVCTNNKGADTVGSHGLTFSQFASSTPLTGSDSITITDGSIAVDYDDSSIGLISSKLAVKDSSLSYGKLASAVAFADGGIELGASGLQLKLNESATPLGSGLTKAAAGASVSIALIDQIVNRAEPFHAFQNTTNATPVNVAPLEPTGNPLDISASVVNVLRCSVSAMKESDNSAAAVWSFDVGTRGANLIGSPVGNAFIDTALAGVNAEPKFVSGAFVVQITGKLSTSLDWKVTVERINCGDV